MKGMRLFDNYEEDGQLSLFSADYDDWDEDWEEAPEEDAKLEGDEQPKQEEKKSVGEDIKPPAGKAVKTKKDIYEKAVAGLEITNSGPTIRVKYCASCGKLLFVKEETAGFHSECNNCGIKYFQKL